MITIDFPSPKRQLSQRQSAVGTVGPATSGYGFSELPMCSYGASGFGGGPLPELKSTSVKACRSRDPRGTTRQNRHSPLKAEFRFFGACDPVGPVADHGLCGVVHSTYSWNRGKGRVADLPIRNVAAMPVLKRMK